MVLGNGAAAAVIESWESATKRNARIFAEIKGFARMNDGKFLMRPDEEAEKLTLCIKNVLSEAGVQPEVVIADGVGLTERDLAEVMAVAKAGKKMKLTGIKAQTGHLMAAAGVTQFNTAVASAMHVILR
jgi:3-oxoacyl-[acyl-carrier-protein] synthase II